MYLYERNTECLTIFSKASKSLGMPDIITKSIILNTLVMVYLLAVKS